METILVTEKTDIVKGKLDAELAKGVLRLVEKGYHLDFPDIPLNENFIAIVFIIYSDTSVIFPDSSIKIYPNTFGDYSGCTEFYKGMMSIDKYNVAIFDLSNFGEKYYNADSLKQIPLENFKSYPTKESIPFCGYDVRDGKLRYYDADIVPSGICTADNEIKLKSKKQLFIRYKPLSTL